MSQRKINLVEIEQMRCEILEGLREHYPEEVNEASTCVRNKAVGAELYNVLKSFEKCQQLWKDGNYSNGRSAVFRQWKTKRIQVIQNLEDMACEFDTHKKYCNIARLVGGSVGAVGGIMTIAGIIAAPFTLGASTPLIIAGTATALSGGATSMVTAITETAIVASKAKDVQTLMLQHEKDSKWLDEWIKDASDFVTAVNKIVDISIFKEIIEAISYLMESYSSSKRIMEESIGKVGKALLPHILKLLHPGAASSCINAVSFILTAPKLFFLLVKVAELHDSHPLVFEAVMLSAKVALQVFRTADLAVDTVTLAISASRVTSAAVAKTMAKAVTHGALAGVGLALDITSIVLTSQSVNKGSKCRHAKKIREAKEKLQENLRYISALCDELCSLNDDQKNVCRKAK